MANIFEDFSLGPAPNIAGADPSDDGLETFEKGYKAGWDDASKAHGDSQTHASAMLARNIEAMEFTLVEARTLVLASLKPVLSEIAETLLPQLTAPALHAQLLAELEPMLAKAAPDVLQLDVSAADAIAVTALLDSRGITEKVALNTRDSLGEGQIFVTCEDVTKRIDVPAAIEDIAAALASFDPESQSLELEHAHAG